MRALLQALFASLLGLALPSISSAQAFAFKDFAVRNIATNGATIHVRTGGSGPAVVLLHGYGETGDMWVPLAADLERVRRMVLIDAPVPGVGPWEEILKNPLLWHFRFGGPDMERLVAGRERIYLDRFWNEFSATPARFSQAARIHYAKLYALPGAMHSGFAQFAAFDQDAIDNRAFLAASGGLKLPILALGGEKSFGPMMATVMRAGGENVTEGIVPDSGHWIMEENPRATIKLVRDFLVAAPAAK